jgi:hypothetical protein
LWVGKGMNHAFRHWASGALACTALGAAVIAPASQANATTVTFDSLGTLSSVLPGETLYTNFGSGLPSTATGSGSIYSAGYGVQCSGGTCVAAPDTTSGLDSEQFFVVTPGESETFTFGYAARDVSVYIGSLDDENSITLNLAGGGSVTYTGAQLAVVSGEESSLSSPIPGGTPTIDGALTNGRWTFTDTSNDIIGITVYNGTAISSNSFEIAQIATSAPEPSTWAMMLLGFAGLGFAGYRRTRTPIGITID